PYPAYPPYSYYPPGYVATASLLSFGAGMAVGAALWGDCDWGHSDVNINTNNYNNFNKTNVASGKWQHNVDHRRGVQYRDRGTQQRYGRTGPGGAQSREAYRGRTQSPQQLARGGTDASRLGGAGGRQGQRGQGAAAPRQQPAQRQPGAQRQPAGG